MAVAMRQLDREIKGYLKFDVHGMSDKMNNAFEGTMTKAETDKLVKDGMRDKHYQKYNAEQNSKKAPLALTTGATG